MGDIIDVLAQEIFIRRAARETIEPGGPPVEKRAEELARQCYILAEGFLRYARARSSDSKPKIG